MSLALAVPFCSSFSLLNCTNRFQDSVSNVKSFIFVEFESNQCHFYHVELLLTNKLSILTKSDEETRDLATMESVLTVAKQTESVHVVVLLVFFCPV